MDDLDYQGYLKIRELLSLQNPVSKPAQHDEMLFIVVHQVFELWFKLMLSELREMRNLMKTERVKEAIACTHRITEILRLFPHQITVLETMTPMSFLKFRDNLKPASGLQSAQFRIVEFMIGIKDERYVKLYEKNSDERKRLETALAEESVCDLLKKYAVKLTKAKSASDEDVIAAIVAIYEKGESGAEPHYTASRFFEELIEMDTAFLDWRGAHVRLAERMIGYKPGTGEKDVEEITLPGETRVKVSRTKSFHASGVKYLQSVADKKCFPLLWVARNFLGESK